MDSLTNNIKHALQVLAASHDTTAATASEPNSLNDSPRVEPRDVPVIKTHEQSAITKMETKFEAKYETIASASAVKHLPIRPTLPHLKTDTEFEVAKEARRVERRWRGMYDRNRVANPGATREPE